MQQQPTIEQRAALPYAGIRMQFRMDEFAAAVDAAFPELFGWLAEQGISPAGPPFIRYHVIDMPARLDVEFGTPVAAAAQGDDRVRQATPGTTMASSPATPPCRTGRRTGVSRSTAGTPTTARPGAVVSSIT